MPSKVCSDFKDKLVAAFSGKPELNTKEKYDIDAWIKLFLEPYDLSSEPKNGKKSAQYEIEKRAKTYARLSKEEQSVLDHEF